MSSLASILASIAISIDYTQKIRKAETLEGKDRDDLRNMNNILWGLYSIEVITMIMMWYITRRARN